MLLLGIFGQSSLERHQEEVLKEVETWNLLIGKEKIDYERNIIAPLYHVLREKYDSWNFSGI